MTARPIPWLVWVYAPYWCWIMCAWKSVDLPILSTPFSAMAESYTSSLLASRFWSSSAMIRMLRMTLRWMARLMSSVTLRPRGLPK